jgi:hypothetical protein
MRALFLLPIIVLTACEPAAFDRERWASGRGADASDNPRESMVCAAIAAGVVPGAKRDEIRELLGPPDGDFAENDIYDVGLEFTSPDEVILSIYYGDQDAAQEVMLHHDWGVEYLRPQTPGTCGGDWAFRRTEQFE